MHDTYMLHLDHTAYPRSPQAALPISSIVESLSWYCLVDSIPATKPQWKHQMTMSLRAQWWEVIRGSDMGDE
jgi:hypothetical protein